MKIWLSYLPSFFPHGLPSAEERWWIAGLWLNISCPVTNIDGDLTDSSFYHFIKNNNYNMTMLTLYFCLTLQVLHNSGSLFYPSFTSPVVCNSHLCLFSPCSFPLLSIFQGQSSAPSSRSLPCRLPSDFTLSSTYNPCSNAEPGAFTASHLLLLRVWHCSFSKWIINPIRAENADFVWATYIREHPLTHLPNRCGLSGINPISTPFSIL